MPAPMPVPIKIKQIIPAPPGWFAKCAKDYAVVAWALVVDVDKTNKPGSIHRATAIEGNVMIGLVATGNQVQNAEAMEGFEGYEYKP